VRTFHLVNWLMQKLLTRFNQCSLNTSRSPERHLRHASCPMPVAQGPICLHPDQAFWSALQPDQTHYRALPLQRASLMQRHPFWAQQVFCPSLHRLCPQNCYWHLLSASWQQMKRWGQHHPQHWLPPLRALLLPLLPAGSRAASCTHHALRTPIMQALIS